MTRTILFLLLSMGLLTATACGSEGSATPTSSPAREWNLEDIQVDGTTVTVSLHVFAGIDVQATLDGKAADKVKPIIPTIEYVFLNVTPGQHTVEVRDVVGFSETADVVVSLPATTPAPTSTPTPTPTPEIPKWLTKLFLGLKNEPLANPPASITQYEYKGQTVYFLPQRCCDIFSVLYDADGNIIGHPDGGITDQGDGRVPDFFDERENERLVWSDHRKYDPELLQVPAPIESVELLIMESFPLQYSVVVVSGLPNACVSYGGYFLSRYGTTVQVEMVNWKPTDPYVVCAEVYQTVTTRIPLGSEFDPDTTYTVDVNGKTIAFKGDSIIVPSK